LLQQGHGAPCQPPPWQVEQTPGGFKVLDANGQALVYVYARETSNEANIARVLTFDEARRMLPELLEAKYGLGYLLRYQLAEK
jgi:hypothetical protein